MVYLPRLVTDFIMEFRTSLWVKICALSQDIFYNNNLNSKWVMEMVMEMVMVDMDD